MKISLKDKKVFIILGILGLAVVYNNFVYSRQKKDINEYTEIIKAYDEDSVNYDGLAMRVAGIDTELKIFYEKIKNIRTLFPPDISQDDVLILMKKFSLESGFTINNISFKELSEVKGRPLSNVSSSTKAASGTDSKNETEKEDKTVSPTKKPTSTDKITAITTKEIESEKYINALNSLGIAYGQSFEQEYGNSNVADGKAYSLGISISGTSDNKQLKDFLYRVQNFTNVTSVGNIQVNSDEEGLLVVNMDVEFYGIADRKAAAEGDYFDVEWTPLKAAGKIDMFKPFDGYIKASDQHVEEKDTAAVQNSSEYSAYDFSMSVLPFGNNMSPPTVSLLGKSVITNEGRMSIIYGDNRENEKVDLYIESVNGEYYCKFKTGHEVFPDATYKNLAKFKPVDEDIRMLIVSSKRTSTNDTSGVAITITNKTGKNLVVDVTDDDNNRPRVSIKKSGDNVIVNYE